MKRRMVVLLTGAVALALAGGGNEARAQQKTPVRAAYIPAITWLCAWVAKDKGFFDRQGLDVSFIVAQNISLLPGVVGKQLDIAPATVVDLVKAAAGGLNVVAVAGGHSDASGEVTNTVIVRKGSGITSVKDFAGKTIGTPTLGGILHIALLYWMKKEGVDPDSIRAVEVPFPNMADQMAAGRLDVAEAVQPFADRMIAAGNISLGDQLLHVANPALSTVWIADRAWAAEHKPIIAQWTQALRDAKAFILANPDEARAIVVKYTKLPAGVVQSITIPDFDASIAPEEIAVWIKVLDELGQLQRTPKAADLIVN
jgi:NitT/TauT family transport system substrate-binding protein